MSNFKTIFKTFDDFNTLVLDKIRYYEDNPDWLNETVKRHYSLNKIYDYLTDYLGDYEHNLDTDELFIKKFRAIFSDEYPAFLTRVKNRQELDFENLKSDWFRSFSNSTSSSVGSNNTSSESRTSDAVGVATFIQQLDNENISTADRSTIENAISSNVDMLNYVSNGYRDYLTLCRSNFKLFLNDFTNVFLPLFTNTAELTERDLEDIPYWNVFANGYIVYEVPYLGQENQANIIKVNQKVDNNRALIDELIRRGGAGGGAGGGADYLGSEPVVVDNTTHTISLDKTFTDSVYSIDEKINEVGGLVSKKQDRITETDILSFNQWNMGGNLEIANNDGNSIAIYYDTNLYFIDKDWNMTTITGGRIEGISDDIDRLKEEDTNLASSIENNKAKIDLVNTSLTTTIERVKVLESKKSENTLFYEGQSLFFVNKQKADNFITKLKLTSDDYEITPYGNVIGTGENGAYIENKLTPEDIPYMTFRGQTFEEEGHIYVKSNALWAASKVKCFINDIDSYGYVSTEYDTDIETWTYDWNPDPSIQTRLPEDKCSWSLNLAHSHTFNGSIGTTSNNSIKSSYLERYEIVFKRDIVR